MKVLLVGNFSADGQFSMQGFVHALAQGLPAQNVTVQMIAPTPFLSRRSKEVHAGMGKWLGYVDKYVLFLPRLRRAARKADLVHICDQGNGVYISQLGSKTPILLTCHDLFAVRAGKKDPELWSLSRTGRFYQRLIWRGICQAQNIACDSDATRLDLTRLIGNNAAAPFSQIVCIPLGLFKPFPKMQETFRQTLLRDECLLDPGQLFLLHVGGNQPYKNRLGLLSIYAAMRRLDPAIPPLVLAGKPLTTEMRRFVADNNLANWVWERTGLSDEALRALYSQAEAFIFPSTMEGFGLPIVEAQACGCPVFTTGQPPMTEVGGDAAVYLDPQDIEGAAQLVVETLRDAEKREAMVRRGFENVATRFTPERMIADYCHLYKAIVKQKDKVD